MLVRYFLVFFVLFCLKGCGPKKETQVLSDEVTPVVVGNVEEGKKLYGSCSTCHGSSGEGKEQLHAPSLVNTDGWYLHRQLMNFKHGIRGSSPGDSLGYQMATVVNILKDSVEISHIVAFIKTMPPVSLPSLITGDIQKGKRTYENICGSCHGQAARGNEKLNAPNLNGLDDWYIKRQVLAFKNGMRGTHPEDTFGAQMVPMMALLTSDQAIDDVIAYIRSTAESETK